MWVRPLVESDASCGGKAVGLARLIAAGLPVPDGVVIDDRAFRHIVGAIAIGELAEIGHALEQAALAVEATAIPADLTSAIAAQVTALGAPAGVVAVRSSASIEDGKGGAAAGVFRSEIAAPADVWRAIRGVWASALTPLAAIYAWSRQGSTASIAIGVIVQRYVAGPRVTIYTRAPGSPTGDAVWIQRGTELERAHRDPGDPLVALALRAEAAIGAATGADVELVVDAAGVAWIVQARPIVHPVMRPRVSPPPTVIAALVADGRAWTWDASHNPAPLSPAQAGLVERVERAGVAPWSMRVCGGYLYTARRDDAAIAPVVAPASVAELATRLASIEETLQRTLGGEPGDLGAALDAYLAFYACWSRELVPLVTAAARAVSPAGMLAHRPSRVRALLESAAAGSTTEAEVIARLGSMSPAWDVAVPTYSETPEILRASIARVRAFATPGSSGPTGPTGPTSASPEGAAADLAERDDDWFYRAQHLVRRAMLARGAELGIARDDICWIPLDDLVAGTLDPDQAHRRAAAARAAHGRAQQWAMPPTVNRLDDHAAPPLRGTGIGPRITGRVVKVDALIGAIAVTPGDIVVCQSVTPALAVLVIGCAALVSESRHDGLLDHGVALARELGITCVVGCRDAWSLLSDGAIVTVDGDGGLVEIVEILENRGLS